MNAVNKNGACLPIVKKYMGKWYIWVGIQTVQKSGSVLCLPAEGRRRKKGVVIGNIQYRTINNQCSNG